jgi:LPPG:FO 2-phospho-L-lactate transferase
MIVVLSGGTGGAKFVDGLRRVVPAEDLTIIVNTGDDHDWWGLHVSPDIDSILYMLAGIVSAERGWGVSGDTFHCLQTMTALGEPNWFSVGDRDLATHLLRTRLLSEVHSLTEATRIITNKLGVGARVLPMSDQKVETLVHTPAGELSFQEFFVKRRYQVEVDSVRFAGAMDAKPAPGTLEAIAAADAILIAPSNPITSIGPILAVPGIREALSKAEAKVAGVSPIIGTQAVSGPAAALMASQNLPPSIAGVAAYYADFLDTLIVDNSDAEASGRPPMQSIHCLATHILMRTDDDRQRIARTALKAAMSQSHTSMEKAS